MNPHLLIRELKEVLVRFVEREDQDCDYDHNGFCQAHYCGKPCVVEQAKALL